MYPIGMILHSLCQTAMLQKNEMDGTTKLWSNDRLALMLVAFS